MKKIFTLLSAVIISSTVFAQIPNSGFELWDSVGTHITPTGWDNLTSLTASAGTYTCEKGYPGTSGSASFMALTSKAVTGMGVAPGVAVSGKLDMATYTPVYGFPYSSRPDSLTGDWEFMAFGSDRGFIAVLLSKWNSATAMRDTVSFSYYTLPGMIMIWERFAIPLSYSTAETPDSAMIFLSSSGATPVANSYLNVDNLAFTTAAPTLISNASATQASSVYPNPATGTANISCNSALAGMADVVITDMGGRTVNTFTSAVHTGQNTWPLNVANWAKGVYSVRINGATSSVVKLVIE